MSNQSLKLNLLAEKFGVCRLDKDSLIPLWANVGIFSSITKTSDELSIVCEQTYIPDNIKCEKDWKALKIVGTLDFSLVGILSKISSILALNNISIFAMSTYDTDYILVKEQDIDNAIKSLGNEDYEVIY